MKHSKKKEQSYRRLGIWTLLIGLVFLLVSFIIHRIFIYDTDFKQEYQTRQFEECITRENAPVECDRDFPDRLP